MTTASRSATASPMSSATPADLVRAACHQDPDAWAELVERYSGAVGHAVGMFRFPEADAADSVQNTWLCALEKLATVDDPDRLGGWLKTVAHRECLQTYRRMRREIPSDAATFDIEADGPGPEAIVTREQVCRAVDRAVARLPERGRHVVRQLFYEGDAEYADISRTMAIPVGSIGPTRQRALHALRRDLEAAGYGLAAG